MRIRFERRGALESSLFALSYSGAKLGLQSMLGFRSQFETASDNAEKGNSRHF